jgi:hypothetical protein
MLCGKTNHLHNVAELTEILLWLCLPPSLFALRFAAFRFNDFHCIFAFLGFRNLGRDHGAKKMKQA